MAYTEVMEPLRRNHWPGRNGHPIEGMVVHVSEGSRNSVTNWFNSPASEASAHVLVCKDGTRVRYVLDADTAWANGVVNGPNLADPIIARWVASNINPNRRTLAVETERRYQERLTKHQLASLCELAVGWHRAHGWPADGTRIWGHYEIDSVNRKNCPSLTRAEWDAVVGAVASAGSTPVTPPEPNTTSELYDMVTGKYVDPSMWAHYRDGGGWRTYGRPLGGSYLYPDGVTRQLFENVVLEAVDGQVRMGGLGQAWYALTRDPAVAWPRVRPLR